jgi:hypothetical protein
MAKDREPGWDFPSATDRPTETEFCLPKTLWKFILILLAKLGN